MATVTRDLNVIMEAAINYNPSADLSIFEGINRFKLFVGIIETNAVIVYGSNNRRLLHTLGITRQGATLPEIRQSLNSTVRMVFKNTPAIILQASIPAQNTTYNQLMSSLTGCFLHESDTSRNIYRITLASLVKELGIDVVKNELIAGGRIADANKLQQKYDEWVANQ